MTDTLKRTGRSLVLALALVALFVSSAHAGTTAVSGYPKFHAVDPDTGELLAGGKLQSYLCGSSTPTDTFADYTGGTANQNPVELDGAGEANVWLDPATCYKLVLKRSDDSVIWTLDGVNTAVAGSFTTISASGAVTFSSTLSVWRGGVPVHGCSGRRDHVERGQRHGADGVHLDHEGCEP
jgi:hypothetical protein